MPLQRVELRVQASPSHPAAELTLDAVLSPETRSSVEFQGLQTHLALCRCPDTAVKSKKPRQTFSLASLFATLDHLLIESERQMSLEILRENFTVRCIYAPFRCGRESEHTNLLCTQTIPQVPLQISERNHGRHIIVELVPCDAETPKPASIATRRANAVPEAAEAGSRSRTRSLALEKLRNLHGFPLEKPTGGPVTFVTYSKYMSGNLSVRASVWKGCLETLWVLVDADTPAAKLEAQFKW